MDNRNQFSSESVQRRVPNQKNGRTLIYAMLALVVMLIIIIAAMLATTLARPSYVARSVTVEAGRPGIFASDFLIDKDNHTAVFAEGVSYDLSSVNNYKIELIVDGKKCTSTLIVVDTQPPSGFVVDISVWEGSKVEASDCVSDIVDATKVEVSFRKAPDTSKVGKQEVTVLLKDEGGNKTEYKLFVTVAAKNSLLYTHYVSELGDPIPSADVFSGKPGIGKYLSDVSIISTESAGTYMLQIEVDGKMHDVVLEIADRTPPSATVTPQSCYNKVPAASDFVTNIVDKSNVTVKYKTEPAVSGTGTYDVMIVLTDSYGNETVYVTYFTLVNDTEAPVIEKAPSELTVDTGSAIAWRASVKASDNSGEFELFLDTSKANLNLPGVYTVEIVARDAAGNEARHPVKLTVNDGSVTDEMLHNVIKSIEKDIGLTPDMDQEYRMYYVFRYVYDSIKYTSTSSHHDWRHEAYATLSGGFAGDCFTYASVSYAILDYLGYEVHLIERAESAKVEGTGTHFWVMVNIGTKSAPEWYHFDATPQAAPYNLPTYLMTNAQLEAFTRWRNSNKLDNFYVYDKEKYPTVSTIIMVDLAIPPEFFH